jgi:hypothetical protein
MVYLRFSSVIHFKLLRKITRNWRLPVLPSMCTYLCVAVYAYMQTCKFIDWGGEGEGVWLRFHRMSQCVTDVLNRKKIFKYLIC